jgi:hypothetical protein
MKNSSFQSTILSSFWDDFVKFFQNVDWVKFCFYGTIIIMAAVVIFFVIRFIYETKKDKKFNQQLLYQSATIRIFKMDASKDTVRFFNLSNIKNVKTIPFRSFYESFPTKEQGKVKEWINALLENRPVTQYLQTDVYFSKDKRTVPSFLKVLKSDTEKGILHIESYLLKYGDPVFKNTNRSFSSESDFAQALKANGAASGLTFCFALMKKDPLNPNKTTLEELPLDLVMSYREAIMPYVTGNQKLIQLAPSELVIANFDMVDISQGIAYALRVKNGIERTLSYSKKKRHAPRFNYEVKIGIVSNKDLLGDSDAILNEARKNAEGGSTKGVVSLYKKDKEEETFSASDELHYRSEVDRIIYEKKLSFSYRPVYCVDKSKIVGYIARALPIGTSFSSIDELKNYAARAKDEKNLFAAVAKNLIPRFISERSEKNQKLFFPVRVSERDNLIPFFSHFPNIKEANIVFLFREAEIANSIDKAGLPGFVALLNSLERVGFSIALSLNDKTLILDHSIYECFDYFFVDFSSGEENNMDTRIRSELHALVERLLKFKKPIIGSNLMNWNSLELVVGSGINYISSDVFAPYEIMFKPITPKNVAKIKAMKNH